MDFFFLSFMTPDWVVVIHTIEYGSTRLYYPIICCIPYPSSESGRIWFLVLGYLNTFTKYLAWMPYACDITDFSLQSSNRNLWHALVPLWLRAWLCFCSSSFYSWNDRMKKKLGPAPWRCVSKYAMWLQPPLSSNTSYKMLWLSWYMRSGSNSLSHFIFHWCFSCCSSISSTS